MRKFFLISVLSVVGLTMSAHANWEYPNRSGRDAWSGDDGMRFVMSVRGGAAYGRAKIQNDIGGLTAQYMINTDTGDIVTKAWQEAVDPTGNYADAGYGRLGDLPAANNYSNISVVAGFSAGLTMPNVPQWRVEFSFDHIAEADYNETPLFDGRLELSSGYSVDAQSGGVQSNISSDIYGVMAFYDFFEGLKKPLHVMIPYIGVGAGYANTKTVLQLTDSYGDLSDVYELQGFGTVDEAGVIQFNKSEIDNSNLTPMAAVGFSYGVNDKMFLDAGIRAMFLPSVKWKLQGEDKTRDWFSAEKMIYLNAMFGVRVEF